MSKKKKSKKTKLGQALLKGMKEILSSKLKERVDWKPEYIGNITEDIPEPEVKKAKIAKIARSKKV